MFDSNSSLTRALYVSTSGMLAQDKRVLLLSQNIANAGTRGSEKGDLPYRRRVITFQSYFDKRAKADLVKVKHIKNDKAPLNKIYSPHDPSADAQGFILESNVKPMAEMMDLQEAMHSHEANLKALERLFSMLQNTIDLLKSN